MNKLILIGSLLLTVALNGQSQSVQSYCTSNLHAAKCAGGYIRYVGIDSTTLHNSSVCNDTVTSYKSFAASDSMTATLIKGKTYKLRYWPWIQAQAAVWIDYNQDGNFASNEYILLSASTSIWNADSSSITIPSTATKGTTRMRIRTRYYSFAIGLTDACTNFGSAETEDYTITIDDVTGINESISERTLDVYPVPAQNGFNVSFETNRSTDAVINLVNVAGQLITSENILSLNGKYNKYFNTESYANGIYYLQIKSDSQVITRKIVVAK